MGLCACAAGEAQKGPTTSLGTLGPAEESSAGDEGEGDTTAPGESGLDADAGELESSSGSDPVGTTSGETTGSGESSSGGEETGGDPSCPEDATCATATVIGMVSGDESSPVIGLELAESTWVSFQVTEDSDSLGGEALTFTATLTSPPGFDFDLFVYRGPDGGATGCGGMLEQSTSAGASDVVHMSWGEGAVANGADERAWVAAEIRPKNGTCDPAASWTLVVEGDT